MTDKVKPTLRDEPEVCPGTYDLDLYCKYDNPDHGAYEFPWIIVDYPTYGQAKRHAQQQGWVIHRDMTATCPKCARALKIK